ncbi:MAG: serine/threonine protein kinase, partial [Acidobacteria bacterium]
MAPAAGGGVPDQGYEAWPGRSPSRFFPRRSPQNKGRLARFEREAKTLAALNHPNIATLFGLEECEGAPFLVMELVEGETLAERIARGAIPMEELLPLFEQIAKGVEAANEKGILHRDLKPANIKITLDDDIKILDFGLAKAFHEEPPISDSSQSPTLSRGTQLGTIMGTYMSPEQARGKALDHRILPVLEDLRGIPGG